jgi:hypothetical protein
MVVSLFFQGVKGDMNLAKLELHITNHAYEQYCERVGSIEYGELRQQCIDLLNSQDYRRKREFLLLGDVWWIYAVEEQKLKLITCYGRVGYDLPQALGWARTHKDQLNLEGWS